MDKAFYLGDNIELMISHLELERPTINITTTIDIRMNVYNPVSTSQERRDPKMEEGEVAHGD